MQYIPSKSIILLLIEISNERVKVKNYFYIQMNFETDQIVIMCTLSNQHNIKFLTSVIYEGKPVA